MPPLVGIALFVLIIAALFVLQYSLGRRYGRGRERLVRDVTMETALRDLNAGTPSGGFLPYVDDRDPSPRERLKERPDE